MHAVFLSTQDLRTAPREGSLAYGKSAAVLNVAAALAGVMQGVTRQLLSRLGSVVD